jgi:hypothetical protein
MFGSGGNDSSEPAPLTGGGAGVGSGPVAGAWVVVLAGLAASEGKGIVSVSSPGFAAG